MNKTYQYVILITDFTVDERVDITRQFSVSPVFTDLQSCKEYAMGRGHAPQTCTSEDIEGIRYKRCIEYDIIDSEGNRMYITWG